MQLRTIKAGKSIETDRLSIDHRSDPMHIKQCFQNTVHADSFFLNHFNKQISILKKDILDILTVQKTILICFNDFCNYEEQI